MYITGPAAKIASSTLLVFGPGAGRTGRFTGGGEVCADKETTLAHVASAHKNLFMQNVR
jgi:hypothetical protein